MSLQDVTLAADCSQRQEADWPLVSSVRKIVSLGYSVRQVDSLPERERDKAGRFDLVSGILQQFSADELRKTILELSEKHCYGCGVDHPSQVQHSCLMWTEGEHFEEALISIDKEAVLNMWREEMKNLEESGWTSRYTMDMSEKSGDAFTQLLEDEEWYRKNLPKPDRLYKDVQDFSQCFKDSLQ
ncbi:unnamed protein product [Mytilus edulis]|uniref:Uncharacterized protein n=1 Tax=Mytilus edulis TaxID=6550 RepID=A0A8S3UGG6_MYTED|nr:unnamed protein product [Mytilus edulis]